MAKSFTDPSRNKDKLGVALLYTSDHRITKTKCLEAALMLAKGNLLAETPSMFYVFTREDMMLQMRERLANVLSSEVILLPIANSSWHIGDNVDPQSSWHHQQYGAEYRLMGEWRAYYMPAFMQAMGHRYAAQLDDDSFILDRLGFNMVQRMDKEDIRMMVRGFSYDPILVTWGLAELAKYFIMASKIMPTQLFNFCSPQNLSGLYTPYTSKDDIEQRNEDQVKALNIPSGGGWNRTLVYGNFLAYSLSWYYEPGPMRFRRIVRASGGHITFRWSEQGLLAMLWQIFLAPQQFLVVDFPYSHKSLFAAKGALAKLNGTKYEGPDEQCI